MVYRRVIHRRDFLSTAGLATGGAVGIAGCVAGGRVVHDRKRSFLLGAGRGWTFEITDVDDTHYFVLDYSNYGNGTAVDEYDDPLDAFVDLTAYDRQLPI